MSGEEQSTRVSSDLHKIPDKAVFVGLQDNDGSKLILGQDTDQVLILGSEPRELTVQMLHEDEMVHALDIDHEQMHSESLNRGQEEDVMEVANLSG